MYIQYARRVRMDVQPPRFREQKITELSLSIHVVKDLSAPSHSVPCRKLHFSSIRALYSIATSSFIAGQGVVNYERFLIDLLRQPWPLGASFLTLHHLTNIERFDTAH